MTIDDTVLLAYLDGQLDDDQYTPVEDALAESAVLRERLQALVESGERIQQAFDAKLQEAVPARLVETVMNAPLNLTPPRHSAAAVPAATPWQRVAALRSALWPAPAAGQGHWGRAAFASVAVLALGVWLGQSLQDNAGAGGALARGGPVSDPSLASVLELAPSGRRLATELGHVEVLATFKRKDGALCREFERQQGAQVDAGIACRTNAQPGNHWQVEMVASATRSEGGFQTASDALHQAVNRHVDEHLQATPLDPVTERTLLDQSWAKK